MELDLYEYPKVVVLLKMEVCEPMVIQLIASIDLSHDLLLLLDSITIITKLARCVE